MTPQRLRAVEMGADLTPEEIATGYHFCMEWDGMCVHPDDPEAEVCGCPLRKGGVDSPCQAGSRNNPAVTDDPS